MPLHQEVFHKALSSDIRRNILLSIAKGEKYLSEISKEIGKKPQTIDFHLAILEGIGLVSGEWKEGKKYYAIADKKILEFIKDDKPVPPHLRHKPPHEIVSEAMDEMKERIERMEKKMDMILKRLR